MDSRLLSESVWAPVSARYKPSVLSGARSTGVLTPIKAAAPTTLPIGRDSKPLIRRTKSAPFTETSFPSVKASSSWRTGCHRQRSEYTSSSVFDQGHWMLPKNLSVHCQHSPSLTDMSLQQLAYANPKRNGVDVYKIAGPGRRCEDKVKLAWDIQNMHQWSLKWLKGRLGQYSRISYPTNISDLATTGMATKPVIRPQDNGWP